MTSRYSPPTSASSVRPALWLGRLGSWSKFKDGSIAQTTYKATAVMCGWLEANVQAPREVEGGTGATTFAEPSLQALARGQAEALLEFAVALGLVVSNTFRGLAGEAWTGEHGRGFGAQLDDVV